MSIIDFTNLPAPNIIEPLAFDAIFESLKTHFAEACPEFDAFIESDPVMKLLEVAAYRELLLRARINNAAKAVMLPYSTGTDLDNLASLYGVTRLVVQPANDNVSPVIPAVYESDDTLRQRALLSLDSHNTAGAISSYRYHALTADGDVRDVSVKSPTPGHVNVTILSHSNSGEASNELVSKVQSALRDEDIRPLTDFITVQAAELVEYRMTATVYFTADLDRDLVINLIHDKLDNYKQALTIGANVHRTAIISLLQQDGVVKVDLQSPATDIEINSNQAAVCTNITLNEVDYVD